MLKKKEYTRVPIQSIIPIMAILFLVERNPSIPRVNPIKAIKIAPIIENAVIVHKKK